MAHHKDKVRVDSCGTEIRLRRDRRRSRPTLTKGSRCDRAPLPNPDPDGGKPLTAWVLNTAWPGYPEERRRRRQRALDKQRERRAILRQEKRAAFAAEEES